MVPSSVGNPNMAIIRGCRALPTGGESEGLCGGLRTTQITVVMV